MPIKIDEGEVYVLNFILLMLLLYIHSENTFHTQKQNESGETLVYTVKSLI